REEARQVDRGRGGGAQGDRTGQALRDAGGIRRGLRVPVLGTGRLHHGPEFVARWRDGSDPVLIFRTAIHKQKGRRNGRPSLVCVRADYLVGSIVVLTGAGSSQRYLMATEKMSICESTLPM